MSKVVSLTVHKNTVGQRRLHEMSKQLVADAKTVASAKRVDGYVIVAWNGTEVPVACWQIGETIPDGMLPDYVRTVLSRKLSNMDANNVVDEKLFGPGEDD